MSRPTEPGYYWLNVSYSGWEIVRVGSLPEDPPNGEVVWFHGWEGPSTVSSYADDQWGGRITQEPVLEPEPPF